MKILIGCLAFIGVLVVIAIIGSVLLVGYGFANFPKKPTYANREEIEKQFSKDLIILNSEIKNNKFDFKNKLSPDVLAIYEDDKDILKLKEYTGKSYFITNDSGVGTLTSSGNKIDCIVYTIKNNEKSYNIYFIDRQKFLLEKNKSKTAPSK